jgi:hypothetical protein
MFSRTASIASAATVTVLTSGPVFAQASPTIVVAFTGASTAVPLDPWTSVAAALFILVVAGTIFRRRLAGRAVGRGLWLAAIAAVTGAAMTGLPVDAIRSAYAPPATPLPLSSSPASVVIGSGFASLLAQNVTGANITILSVAITNPAVGQSIQTPPTTCAPGLVLAPGQTCLIQVDTLPS